MTEMSAAEAATVARFEAGEPAPESWDGGLREAIARTLYEADCAYNGDSGVSWDDPLLGPEVLGLRNAYRASAAAVLALPEVAALRAKAASVDRVRELLDHMARNRAYDLGTVQVVRRALDGPGRTDRGRC